MDTSTVINASILSDPLSPRDLLPLWPFPIPDYLLNPPHTGKRPAPFVLSAPILQLDFLCLAHAVSATLHAPQRAIGLLLQVITIGMRFLRQLDRLRPREHSLQRCLSLTADALEALDRLSLFQMSYGDKTFTDCQRSVPTVIISWVPKCRTSNPTLARKHYHSLDRSLAVWFCSSLARFGYR